MDYPQRLKREETKKRSKNEGNKWARLADGLLGGSEDYENIMVV